MKKKRVVRNLAKDRKRDLRLRVVDVDVENSPEMKSFECRIRLTYNSEDYECRGDLVQQGDGHLNEGLELAKRIFEIDGVQEVEIREYRVYVTLSEAFDWEMDDLVMPVKKAISGYLDEIFIADNLIKEVNEKFNKSKE